MEIGWARRRAGLDNNENSIRQALARIRNGH